MGVNRGSSDGFRQGRIYEYLIASCTGDAIPAPLNRDAQTGDPDAARLQFLVGPPTLGQAHLALILVGCSPRDKWIVIPNGSIKDPRE